MSARDQRFCRPFLLLAICVTSRLIVTADIANATEFRIDLDSVVNDAYPDDNFLRAEFDLGTRLSSIESVTIEFIMPSGHSPGFAYGAGIQGSVFDVQLHGIDHVADRPIKPTPYSGLDSFDDPEQLRYGFTSVTPDRLISRELWNINRPSRITIADNSLVEPSDGLKPGEMPSFLFSGVGAVTFQQKISFSPSWFNSPADEPTTLSFHKPPEISFASIVIEATPVPEPAGASGLGILVVIGMLRKRMHRPRSYSGCDVSRRYRYSVENLGRSRDGSESEFRTR